MQQDFILRMIERLGVLFAAIRKLILSGGDPTEIQDRMQAAAETSGWDLELVRRLDPESLMATVMLGGDLDVSRAWTLAELLLLDGLRASRDGDVEAAERHLVTSRALFELFGDARSMTRAFPESASRLAEIDTELDRLSAPSRDTRATGA